jgi:transketolase
MNAEQLRAAAVALLVQADDGHPGSVMSLVEIVLEATKGMNLLHDKLIISKGHGGMVIYPLLLEAGLVSLSEYADFRKVGAPLTMFPHAGIPGVPAGCGSLGQGVGYGCGFAMADPSSRVRVIISEGELYEGSTFEALMFARHYGMANLTVYVDKNDAITLGTTEDCLSIPWKVLDEFPFVHVRQTVKGKGVAAWEGKIGSHYWSRP